MHMEEPGDFVRVLWCLVSHLLCCKIRWQHHDSLVPESDSHRDLWKRLREKGCREGRLACKLGHCLEYLQLVLHTCKHDLEATSWKQGRRVEAWKFHYLAVGGKAHQAESHHCADKGSRLQHLSFHTSQNQTFPNSCSVLYCDNSKPNTRQLLDLSPETTLLP